LDIWSFNSVVHNFDIDSSSFLGASIKKHTLSNVEAESLISKFNAVPNIEAQNLSKNLIMKLLQYRSFMMPISAYTNIVSLYSISKLDKIPDFNISYVYVIIDLYYHDISNYNITLQYQ
jgi:hypothetical protein